MSLSARLRDLPHQRFLHLLFWTAFVGLILFRPFSLTRPPYWDGVLGPFAEASWLVEHDFDYYRLATQEKDGVKGGGRIYFFSIYPGLLGLTIKGLGIQGALFVFHVITRLAAAFSAVCFYRILSRHLDRLPATLGALTLLTTPLFLSQATVVNMELPILTCTLAAWASFVESRHLRAAAWMTLGCCIKYSCVYIAGGLFALFVLTRLRSLRDVGKAALYAVPLIGYVLQNMVAGRLFSQPLQGSKLVFWHFHPDMIPKLILNKILEAPQPYILLLLGLVVAGVALLTGLWQEFRAHPWRWKAIWSRVTTVAERESSMVLSLYTGGVILLLIILMRIFLPRYMTLQLGFILFPLLVVAGARKPPLRYILLGLLLTVNVINHRGALGRLISDAHLGRGGHVLERSMEYEADLLLNQRFCRLLENEYADHPIVTPWPLLHQLADPRQGYVRKGLQVHPAQTKSLLWLSNVTPEPETLPPNVLWVDAPSVFNGRNKHALHLKPEYEEVRHLQVKDREIWLVRLKPGATPP